MSGPVLVFHDYPDAEAVAIGWLTAKSIRASSALPSTPVFPCVTLSRIGGLGRWVDLARIQLSGWGATKQAARDVTVAALTALYSMPRQVTTADVTLVIPDGGLSWQLDDTTNPPRPRYIAGVAISLR